MAAANWSENIFLKAAAINGAVTVFGRPLCKSNHSRETSSIFWRANTMIIRKWNHLEYWYCKCSKDIKQLIIKILKKIIFDHILKICQVIMASLVNTFSKWLMRQFLGSTLPQLQQSWSLESPHVEKLLCIGFIKFSLFALGRSINLVSL